MVNHPVRRSQLAATEPVALRFRRGGSDISRLRRNWPSACFVFIQKVTFYAINARGHIVRLTIKKHHGWHINQQRRSSIGPNN